MNSDLESVVQTAREAAGEADAVLITAGAGIGVDSGLPDFRGTIGFWKAYPPIAKLGLSFEEMANPQWFDRKPRLAWAFYGHRLALYRRTVPFPGFRRLLDFASQKPGGYFVFTSNVDGQFQKAGFEEDRIEECHGSIHHFQCVRPCCEAVWDASHIDVRVDEERFEAFDPLPSCPHCGGLARPNVLMFGDWTWIEDRTGRQGTRLRQWLGTVEHDGHRLVVIEVGAGTAVATVRYTSERIAGGLHAALIRINPRDTLVPPGQFALPFGAAEGIRLLLD
jgi:NAD-dependent SIR2 family protein deacetylase